VFISMDSNKKEVFIPEYEPKKTLYWRIIYIYRFFFIFSFGRVDANKKHLILISSWFTLSAIYDTIKKYFDIYKGRIGGGGGELKTQSKRMFL